jgi:hypothetical protein
LNVASGRIADPIASRIRAALLALLVCAAAPVSVGARLSATPPQANGPTYHLETIKGGLPALRRQFSQNQLELLERVNRADLAHLAQFPSLVVPDLWAADELVCSPLPALYPSAESYPKLLVVEQSHQVFGAYEFGQLARWGPVSSGRQNSRTPTGFFHLNWRSQGRHSTVDPEWFMTWYFNFDNALGLSLHQYALPGRPASHACIRLLERDAVWLFDWGDQWKLDPQRHAVVEVGTPLLVVGNYDFKAPPPWRSLHPPAMTVQLPPAPR